VETAATKIAAGASLALTVVKVVHVDINEA
jgi:hypothetical protein